MTNVTCGLTAKKPGSAPCPTLIIEYGTTLLFLLTKGQLPVNIYLEETKTISLVLFSFTFFYDLWTENGAGPILTTPEPIRDYATDKKVTQQQTAKRWL